MRALILGPTVTLLLVTPATSAAASRTAPTCTPVTTNNSAVLAGSVMVSPLPGSRDASPRTQISFLGVPAGELSAINVRGARTGFHAGRLLPYSQGDGASFLPGRPFAEGEQVTVRARLLVGRSVKLLFDRFVVADQDAISFVPEAIHAGAPTEVQSFTSRPDLQPPVVTVNTQSAAAAPGDEFVAPYTGPGQAGPMILDATGGLLWFKPLRTHSSATNLRVQEYNQRPALTWWQGVASVHGFGRGEDVIDDSSYTEIARVGAGNGYQADLHEFELTPRGTALITVYAPILCNLSSIGGPAYGAVTDGMIQEIDISTGLVKREWTSLDHVPMGESYESPRHSTTSWPFDFFHINSIDFERDGSLLASARNTRAIYDVDGRSGQIAWRLGGKRSSFAMGPGTGLAYQHDPRELPDGTISVFDNGASPAVHSQSRGVVLSIDQQRKAVTRVSQIVHTPPLLAESQGNLQALPNGDWFVGWGQVPQFSEFDAEGALLFDARFPRWTQSYRSYRFPWSGMPAHAPSVIFKPAAVGGGVVYASWNGATLVVSWRVLAGVDPSSLNPAARVARNGFETAITVPAGTVGPYVSVQAIDAGGRVLGVSPAVSEPGLAAGG
ncbi:MAG TPA: arylsulfotransferase family protein [Solirubrobacteraceae bacterium]|nr:arylsulfotransferase family protein [Solirubrobacteraceae bacterium]